MTKLEELTSGSIVKGILPNQSVTVIQAQWYGSDVVKLTYNGNLLLKALLLQKTY